MEEKTHSFTFNQQSIELLIAACDDRMRSALVGPHLKLSNEIDEGKELARCRDAIAYHGLRNELTEGWRKLVHGEGRN